MQIEPDFLLFVMIWVDGFVHETNHIQRKSGGGSTQLAPHGEEEPKAEQGLGDGDPDV